MCSHMTSILDIGAGAYHQSFARRCSRRLSPHAKIDIFRRDTLPEHHVIPVTVCIAARQWRGGGGESEASIDTLGV